MLDLQLDLANLVEEVAFAAESNPLLIGRIRAAKDRIGLILKSVSKPIRINGEGEVEE